MSHQYIDISTDFKKVSDEFHKLTMYPADVWTWKHLAYYFKNLSVTAASIVEHQDLQAVTDLGNTTTNSITVNGVTSPYYLLDTTATPTPQQGMLFWDEDRSTVGLQMNGVEARLGQDNFWYVKNQTGSPIPKGTAVMAVGALGASSRILVAPMVADGSVDEQYFLGITAEEILNGEDGFVTNIGKIRGIDTSVYGTQAGQILYCDPANPGGFTITQPQAPNLNIPAAFTVDYKSNGTIAVRALPGYHLSELHDVYINTPSDQDILLYNGTNNRWENTPLASAVPTPTLQTVTDAGNSTANAVEVGGLTVDTDLIYTDTVNGRVGIGTTTPSYKFHLVDSNTSVGGSYASPFYLSLNRSSSGGSPLATYFTQEHYTLGGTDSFGNSLGKQILANINNTGNSTYRNLYSRVHTLGSGGANHIALYSTHFEGYGTGTINNFYGTIIGGSAISSFSNVYSTIKNTYGLYFGSLTSGTQTNAPYAIYQSGTEKNYFGGNLLIGTTTDAGYKLQVNGDATINGVRVGLGGGSVSTNTVVGNEAGNSNTTGSITAIGYRALKENTTGVGLTAIGYQALKNSTGADNTALGYAAASNTTTGIRNTAIGKDALVTNLTGLDNVAVGESALRNNTSSFNTAVGREAALSNTSGNSNTAVGYQSLKSNATSSGNSAVGLYALLNTTAASNTAVGQNAGRYNTTGSNNIFIGKGSDGVSATDSNRTWIGNNSTTSTWVGGNLLVGTTTDSGYKLDVNGTARIGDASSNQTALNLFAYTSSSVTSNYALGIHDETNTKRFGLNYSSAAQYFSSYGGALFINRFGEDVYIGNYGNNGALHVRYNTGRVTIGKGNSISNALSNLYVNGNISVGTNAAAPSNGGIFSGNVLIGTTTDAGYKLDVNGNLRTQNDAYFATTSGNVGIGTTSPTNTLQVQPPLTAFDLNSLSNGAIALTNNSNGSFAPTIGAKSTSTSQPGLQIITGTNDTNTYADMIFSVRESNNTDFATTSSTAFAFNRYITNLLTILRNGNVGIGTTTPADQLEVVGYAKASTGFKIGNYNIINSGGNGLSINSSAYYPVRFYTNNAERMRISEAGNVLIGTTTDAGYKLQVNGDATINGVRVGLGGGSITDNTVLGNEALNLNTTGNRTVAIGQFALRSNTTGVNQVAVGWYALRVNTTGNGNQAFGYRALENNKTGGQNVAVGYQTLQGNIAGSSNVGVGHKALYNTTGSYNTAIGRDSGLNNITGSGNVFLGYQAGYNETGSDKLYIANSSTNNLIYGDFSTGNVSIGSTVDAGYKLDVNGSTRIVGEGTTSATTSFRVQNADLVSGLFVNDAIQVALGINAYVIPGADVSIIGSTIVQGQTNNTFLYLRAKDNNFTTGIRAQNSDSSANWSLEGNNTGTTKLAVSNGDLSLETESAKQIAFKTTNLERARITAGGNLLIGTTTDAGYKLDVNGDTRVVGAIKQEHPTYTGTHTIGFSANNTIRFINSGIGTYLIVGSSNVFDTVGQRIKSVTRGADFGSSVVGRSKVVDIINIPTFTSGTTDSAGVSIEYSINNTGTYVGTTRGIYYNPTLTSLTGTTHRAIETTSGDVIFNGGNVGIGTSSPTDKLTVIGGNIVTDGALKLNGTAGLLFNQINGTPFSPTPGIFYGSEGWYFQVPNNGVEKFSFKLGSTASNRQFRVVDNSWNSLFQVQGNGNLLIGTTTDAGYKLDVNGDVNSNGDYYNNGIQGYTGTFTIIQDAPNPPINVDVNGGIITNVY